MAEPLKHFFSKALVLELAASIARVHPDFPREKFVRTASKGLDALELLDRARLIARALHTHLPRTYADAIDILVRSLGPEHATDELEGVGMAPFFYLPHVFFVADHGLADFDLSMRAQIELTKRFTCESSIRRFIDANPEHTWRFFETWAHDPNPHVRRLVSEGTRQRLPWAERVRFLDENPERIAALLETLKDDGASLVRRSVANNLNDLGKSHPALLTSICERWLRGATPERRALVEHALRSAVKRGDKKALALLGYGRRARVEVQGVAFDPARVRIGQRTRMTFTLVNRASSCATLNVDVRVHFVKARSKTCAKVFKVARVELDPGASCALGKTFSLAVHTTRKPRPGKHAVELLVNGVVLQAGAFEVVGPTRIR